VPEVKQAFLGLLAATLLAGCSTVHARPATRPSAPAAPADAVAASAVPQAGEAPLSSYLRQLREVSRRARPGPTGAELAERWSADLAAAISSYTASPTYAGLIGLAQAYTRAGILDKAHEYFASASRLDPKDGAAWDGLARIWRDWGFPAYGLGDAYRAVHAAPGSPAARNTLGTILQILGEGRAARAQFASALALDAGAAYARNNLCYSWLMEGAAADASAECRAALDLDPGLRVARNNLALATAITGDLAGARDIFGAVGGEAVAQYNLGIVYMAQRRYAAAAGAFDRAAALQPSLTMARARARQAHQRAVDAADPGGSHERR
jgi:Flp pilus assembly protein TadD